MVKYSSFLPETTDRQKAFPPDEIFELVVKQDGFGMFGSPEWRRTTKYKRSDIPRYEPCLNRRCQQGGLDLQMQVISAKADGQERTYTYSCRGHEGTPKGRRVGNPCDNSFTVSVTKMKLPKP